LDFTGKIALVTGAAGGIGYATATLLGIYGAKVIVTDIQQKNGKEVGEKFERAGIDTTYIPADISKIQDIATLFSKIKEQFKKLDILVNGAGITSLTAIPEISREEWDEVLAVNLTSTFFCSQAALNIMCEQKSGKIINIASNAGRVGGIAVGAHYSASKAGIICLTKSLALYGASYDINVNCVAPGPITTPMTRGWDEKTSDNLISKIPLKRFGKPEEVGETICFLASDKSSFMTGATIDVNGGLVMC
jgi:3-oxoacyl-[acyl-carrier protein] reductase